MSFETPDNLGETMPIEFEPVEIKEAMFDISGKAARAFLEIEKERQGKAEG